MYKIIDESNSLIENGILKKCEVSEHMDIKGCKVVCGDAEDIDKPNCVFYEPFRQSKVIKSVRSDAEAIGTKCFEWCTALENVVLIGTKEIEWAAFSGCTSLKEILIPETVEIMREGCFDYIPYIEIQFEGGREQVERIDQKSDSHWLDKCKTSDDGKECVAIIGEKPEEDTDKFEGYIDISNLEDIGE